MSTPRRRPSRGGRSRGQILVLFALCALIVFGMLGVAIDGSFGLVQNRRAQNGSDFGAFAATAQLNGTAVCNGNGANPDMAQIVAIIQEEINANAAQVGTSWTGHFLNGAGQPLGNGTFTSTTTSWSGNPLASTYPPPAACGVAVDAQPNWNGFLSSLLGQSVLHGYAAGSVTNSTKGSPVSIVALNKVGPHAVLGGGSGSFNVVGDMYLNTTVNNQPWTQTAQGWAWDDAVDAKTSSNLSVWGTIHTAQTVYNGNLAWPLDWCFDGSAPQGQGSDQKGDPTYPTPPTYSPSCSVGNVGLHYNHIDPTWTPINDPLQVGGAPSDPTSSATNIACPGESMAADTYASLAAGETTVNGVVTLLPGEYTSPIKITSSVTFGDCSAYPGEPAYPGIYKFDQGLWIDPPVGDTVGGSNVLLSFENPYPLAGNVPGSVSGGTFTASGSGNGAPCLPNKTPISSGSGYENDGSAGSKCGGTSQYGVIAYGDSSFQPVSGFYGTGENYSLLIGGGGTVTLTGPLSGEYSGANGNPGEVLYQDPNVQANFGLDGEPGDSASISLTGVVYDASLASYGGSAPLDYWDVGIPFYAGGTLQAGNGAGWSTPTESSGSVTITGTTIVDQFNTDGQTSITILGQPFALPSSGTPTLVG